MKKIIVLVLFLVGFSACRSTKKVLTKTNTAIQTTKETDIIKLDTTFFIPGDLATIIIPIEKSKIKRSESPKVFTQTKGRATVTVKIDSIGITATSNCDSIAQELRFYQKKVREMSYTNTQSETQETIKKGYNLFELILYIAAVAIVSFVAGYLLKTFKII